MTTALDLQGEPRANDGAGIRASIAGREFIFLVTRLPEPAPCDSRLMRRTATGCWSVRL